MTPLTAEEIAELRRLDREAAPLPWRAERTGHEEEDAVTRVIQPRFSQNAAICGADSDGQFIATARNALPRLLDEVERWRNPEAVRMWRDENAATLERARALLKRIEWVGEVSGHCPECGADGNSPDQRNRIHEPGCELAALIGASGVRPG